MIYRVNDDRPLICRATTDPRSHASHSSLASSLLIDQLMRVLSQSSFKNYLSLLVVFTAHVAQTPYIYMQYVSNLI